METEEVVEQLKAYATTEWRTLPLPEKLLAASLSILLDRIKPTPDPLMWPQLNGNIEWEPSYGDDEDPESRLTAAFYINGLPMHLEARAVERDDAGIQIGVGPYPEDIDVLSAFAGEPDGGFMTTHINGREYVLVAYPFSD